MTMDFKHIYNDFLKDQEGTLAIFFALALMVLCTVVSMSVDGARAVNAYHRAANALDAAALAAAKALNEQGASDSELYDIATTVFQENAKNKKNDGVAYKNLNLKVDRSKNSVNATVEGKVTTTFAQIISVPHIDIKTSSTAIYNSKDIELSLMLDVTGSMRGSKIRSLKTAANQMVDILLQESGGSQLTRIALAPYAASVNAGSYASRVSGGNSVDGCVFERSNHLAYTDYAPGRNSYLNSMANPRRPTNNKYGCPQAEILPLTDDIKKIKRYINDIRVGGWTAGHLGTAWAWYLISPNWSSVWPTESEPVKYSDAKTIKVAVLMTDGEFNTSYFNGRQNRTSSAQTRQLCERMKEENIQIYSVAFLAPKSAQQTLKNCASSDQHYFNAKNNQDLVNTFKDIAVRLSKLRISE